MFKPKAGSWYLSSKTDERWNHSGRTTVLLFSGGPPEEVKSKIEELKNKLGDPPADLEWGGMKD